MALTCPGCGFELKSQFFESPDYHPCHVCGAEISALTFPACFVPQQQIDAADLRREEDDAGCFYHESKKAVESCSQCGRFVCALCAAEMGNGILCPGCIVSGEKQSTLPLLERERTLYDSMALMIAVVPALTISLSIIGAPIAVYVALRYWKRPSSMVRRVGWRKWMALGLGLAQVGAWVWLLMYLVLFRRTLQS